MSNLVKRRSESVVETYGFPVFGVPADEREPLPDNQGAPGPESDEPELGPEELYRRKLLELERRAQEIERDAYAKGFAHGERDGLDYGQKTVQVIKSQLERVAEGLESLPGAIFRDYRTWFISAVMRMAKRVVGAELALSPEAVARVLNTLLDEAEESSCLCAYLNPLDLEFMEKRADLVLNPKGRRFTLIADPGLERGGCRVESDIQVLDASIDTQFELLEKHLLSGSGKATARLPVVADDGD